MEFFPTAKSRHKVIQSSLWNPINVVCALLCAYLYLPLVVGPFPRFSDKSPPADAVGEGESEWKREKSKLIKFLVRLVCAIASLNYISVVENSRIVSLIFYVNASL